jgi:predicted methyltransferase
MRIVIVLLLISFSVSAQDTYKNIYSSHAWKERDAWQKPNELIKLLKIGAGSQTADIGCHEGYMTFKLASVVGATGKVYAVDRQLKDPETKGIGRKNSSNHSGQR